MQILGIDIGGTGIKGAPVETTTGEMLAERYRIPTPDKSTPETVADVVAHIAEHFEWRGPVGCGYPGVVKHGYTLTAANVAKKWIGANAAQIIEHRLRLPVTLLNDADAAGLAEMAYGSGKGFTGSAVLVTIGTGLGVALFTNGHLWPNCEMGHVEIKGEAAELRASFAAKEREDLSLKDWSHRFDRYLHELERLLWPDLFILGGGGVKKYDEFADRLTVQTRVVKAHFGNRAGIIGAALAYEKITSGSL